MVNPRDQKSVENEAKQDRSTQKDLRLISFKPDLEGPQTPGRYITFKAKTSKIGSGAVSYRFWLKSPSKDWRPIAGWGKIDRLTWVPTKADIGVCQVRIEIRRNNQAEDVRIDDPCVIG